MRVSAFPALKLLWHRADRVRVVLRSYRSSVGELQSLLRESGDTGSLEVSVGQAQLGLLRLHDATLRKDGASLQASGRVLESDLRAAVPFLQDVTPVASGAGTLTLRGRAGALGLSVSASATVAASGGTLVVAPDVPLGGLAAITLFSDPAVEVLSVSGAPPPSGFAVAATARLR